MNNYNIYNACLQRMRERRARVAYTTTVDMDESDSDCIVIEESRDDFVVIDVSPSPIRPVKVESR